MSNPLNVIDRRTAPVVLATAAAAAATGVGLSLSATMMPGAERLSVEDVVDATAMLALGGLGAVLLRRGVAEGLARALVLLAAVVGLMWLAGGLADRLADGEDPPLVAQLLCLTGSVLFIPVFVLTTQLPLLLFPTGRLPSARWHWVVPTAATGVAASMVALLLAPGYLDEDVRAWGDNPIGAPALDAWTSVAEAGGAVLVVTSAGASLAALVTRLVRYRGPRRRQMWWFLAGATPLVVGIMTDVSSSEVVQVASAVVIFGCLIGGMAWALLGRPACAVIAESRDDIGQLQP